MGFFAPEVGLEEPLAKKKSNFVDALTKRAIDSSPNGLFSGAMACGFGILLISITPFVPEVWEQWFQWGCFAIFVSGTVKIFFELFLKK